MRSRENGLNIVRAKSPLRISFAGGGTDLPSYYEDNGGAVLSATINRYAYATLSPQPNHEIRIRSFDLGYTVKYEVNESPVYDGMLDLAKAALERVSLESGIALDIRSDAPPGSGLGGSSAVTSAILGTLAELSKASLTNYDMAELNYTVERIDLGISGGKQDQYATTFGGFNVIEFNEDKVVVTPLRISRSTLNDLEAHLLLCYTGSVRADLGLIDKQVDYYRKGRENTLQGLRGLYELVFEMRDALLTGELEDFGNLLHQSYVFKKQMNPHIAEGTPADLLYQTAMEHGTLGGKLCGAGGGGYLLLFCETAKQQEVRKELEKLGGKFTDFSFDKMGLQVWRSKCP